MSQTLSAVLYTDAKAYERERSTIFGHEWMILGRTADLEQAGGYIAEEIAGYPIFVAVDGDGIPWAYHNVCPHRGGPIFFPGRGHTDRLTCQYHGWCFSYEGKLVEMPSFGDNPDMDVEQQRLRQVSIGNWGGFLWVALAGNVPPLKEALATLVDDTADVPFEELTHTAHITKVLDCNWKIFVENYLETYHVPTTHSVLNAHFDLDASFVQVHDQTYTRQTAVTTSGVPMRWFYRYPNTALQVLGSTLAWAQILPQGPDKTMIVLDHYAPPGVDDTPLRSLLENTVEEDARICNALQKNMQSGMFDRGYHSPIHETALGWFANMIMKAHDIRLDV